MALARRTQACANPRPRHRPPPPARLPRPPSPTRPSWPWFIGGVLAGSVLLLAIQPAAPANHAPTTPANRDGAAPDSAAFATRSTTPLPPNWSLDTPPSADELDARIASWLALDPAVTPYSERALGLRALLLLADARQLAALADRLARRGGADDAIWFPRVFSRWAELSPADATRWTAKLGAAARIPADTLARAREQAGLAWAAQAFDPAYAWALAQPDADAPAGLAARLLGWLAEHDPSRALALAETRGAAITTAMARPIFEAWAKHAPADALRALGPHLLAAGSSGYDLADPLRGWFLQSPDEALTWIAAQPRLLDWSKDPRGFGSVLGAHNDRLAHFEAAKRLTDPELKHKLLGGLLIYSWSGDPAQAADLIDRLDDPALRSRLAYDASRVTFGTIERNLPYALLLPPGGERNARLTELTTKWAERDPVAALQWLNRQDDPSLAPVIAPVQAAVLGAIAEDEPQTAIATWSELPAGPIRDQAVNKIAAGWAKQDPAAAAAWLDTQHPAASASRKVDWSTAGAITQNWVERDPAAALAWTESRASAPNDYTPVYAWAQAVSEKLPTAAAADQIGHIADLPTRRQALFNHVHRWLSTDLAAAEAWLKQQNYVAPKIARAWIDEARNEAAR